MAKDLQKIIVLLAVVLVGAGVWWLAAGQPTGQSGALVSEVTYQCNEGKSINAKFYEGPKAPTPAPGQPPTPTGYVKLKLSDGRSMTLNQTISADGIRYSNGNPQVQGDESFVFWSKGNTALVLENNVEKSYINCIDATTGSPLPSSDVPPSAATQDEGQVFCTADAKQCPDGTWVGRTGPNCEFVCPGDEASTSTNASSSLP